MIRPLSLSLSLRRFKLPLILAAALIASCDKSAEKGGIDDNNDDQSDATTLVIDVLPENVTMTRAKYADEGLTLSWMSGDALRLYTSAGDVVDWFCRTDGSCAFELDGDGITKEDYKADSYKLFFPGEKGASSYDTFNNITLDYTGQHQSSNNNTDNLADYTFLTATTTSIESDVQMKHYSAQIKFLMTPPDDTEAASIKYLIFEADKDVFIEKSNLDGSAQSFTNRLELELTINDGELTSDNNYLLKAYMMIHPVILSDTNLTITLTDANGNAIVSKSESVSYREYVAGVQQYALFTDNPDLYADTVISDANVSWTQFGPGMSGNNKCARWHPTDPNYLYIAPNMGNTYVSTDAGKTYQTVLKFDAATDARGLGEITSVDFSRSDDTFGFATDDNKTGIFITHDKGITWDYALDESGDILFDGTYLSCVAVDPTDDNIWYVASGRMRDLGQLGFTEGSRGHYTSSKTVFESGGKSVYKSIDKGATWTNSSAGINGSADAESIFVNPNDPTMLFLSTNYGFYKSTNSGKTWTKKSVDSDTDVLRSLTMCNVGGAVTLYALSNIEWSMSGSADSNPTITDKWGGVFKSTDLGETWSSADPNNKLSLNLAALSNYTVRTAFQKTATYFFQESVTFTGNTKVPSSITQRFQTVVVSPNDPNLVFLTCDYANGGESCFIPGQLWRSKDGGENWEVAYRNGTMWLDGSSNYDFWSNRGNTMGNNANFEYLDEWEARSDYDSKSCNFIAFNCTGEIIHTQNAKISMFSYNDGDDWYDIDDTATDDGVEDSYIGGGNSNLPGHGFTQHPDLPGQVFCHAGENQLWVTNSGTSSSYTGSSYLAVTNFRVFDEEESSMSWSAIDPNDSNIRYALFFRQSGAGNLYRTVDGGVTWDELKEPHSSDVMGVGGISDRIHQVSFIIDPQNSQNMYFCVPWKTLDLAYVGESEDGWGIHKSSDGGKTWKHSVAGLPAANDNKDNTTVSPSGLYNGAPSVTRLAFDPDNSNTIYAAVEKKGGGLYRSTDNGENWSEVESCAHLMNYEGDSTKVGCTDIHFAQDGTAFITVGSKNASADDPYCGIWASYDGLKSWHKLFAHANPVRVETARYDSNIILATTLHSVSMNGLNSGVFISRDGGATWGKINNGNGQANEVNDIAIDYSRKGRYYASTYGSGWYFTDDPLVQ